jgi:hypothetical protein
MGEERLDERGQDRRRCSPSSRGRPPDELLGAWLAKESVRAVYLVDDPVEAASRLDDALLEERRDAVPPGRRLR